MNAPTDWGSAVAILAAGLILGALFVYFFSRRNVSKTLGGEPDLEFQDLEAKRDALVQRLRDLGENASAEERRRLEVETAEVLRQIDGYERAPVAEAARKREPAPAMNPAVKGFIWGAASVAALAGLAWFVMSSATPREEGGLMTGGIESQQPAQQPAPPDPMVAQLEAAVRNDPSNLQLRNDLAQAYLERDNLMGVFEQTKFVLEKSPNDSRALVFQALVRMAMGDGDSANKMLQQATQSDPANLDAWVARAWIYAQQDQMQEAETMIAEAARQSPADKQRLEEVFTQMKAHVAQLKTAQAGGMPDGHPPVDGDLPSGHPPVGQAAPAAQAAAMQRPAPPSDGRSISVTLDVDAAASSKSGVVYVMARPPAGGPPVAVKRLQVAAFPITFELGSADSMMGQPLPDTFRLEARLDSDGDAATKRPTDPSARQDGVAPGAKVRMALK